MKYTLFLGLLVIMCSCERKSWYYCNCDVYGDKTKVYLPHSTRYGYEEYRNETETNADKKCKAYEQKYRAIFNDSLDGGKWIDCGITEVDYGQK